MRGNARRPREGGGLNQNEAQTSGSSRPKGPRLRGGDVLALTLLLAACTTAPVAPKQDASKGGPPPIPPYQMRAELASGDRLASGGNGEKLYSNRCGSCHLAGGMGTNLLTKQRMMLGEPPENGMLANRKDLTADYVKTVVRQGKMAMPRLSRVEVTDGELEAIAKYLGKAGS